MKIKNILILLLLLCFTFSLAAQDRQRRGRFDIDAFIQKKSEYLKKELNLTDAEAKAFFPLEAEFSKKKFEVNRDARRETRELKKKQNKTDADYKRIVQLDLQSEQKESELQIEYFRKFAAVLPAEKLEKYRAADIKFKEDALKRHREKHHPGEKFD
ncbi:hypothetical protein D0T84_04515 [Dysgonomonas sp. 521]|uniref:hypothetical protein n=1 Tax=Dysgonomonas sp. 521 TaxID=2302932 RepID=UPI0013D34DA2|nr:hypothetical protein [Dysgonomonas sp. 521]NDV94181.1 hypothetical protein [Dysgonomonas sp. 521]